MLFSLSQPPRFPRSLFAMLYAATLYLIARLFLWTVRDKKKKKKASPSGSESGSSFRSALSLVSLLFSIVRRHR
jgi:hypothetical protein